MYDPSLSLLSLPFTFQRFDPLLQCSAYGGLKDRLASCLLLKNLGLHRSICDKTIGGDSMIQVSHSVDTRVRLRLIPQNVETAIKHHPLSDIQGHTGPKIRVVPMRNAVSYFTLSSLSQSRGEALWKPSMWFPRSWCVATLGHSAY